MKQRESSHNDQLVVTQRGQSSRPHFCIVGGVSKPASSHKLLATFCVLLLRLTIQCAALTYKLFTISYSTVYFYFDILGNDLLQMLQIK